MFLDAVPMTGFSEVATYCFYPFKAWIAFARKAGRVAPSYHDTPFAYRVLARSS